MFAALSMAARSERQNGVWLPSIQTARFNISGDGASHAVTCSKIGVVQHFDSDSFTASASSTTVNYLVDPFVFAIATDKNQCQRICLRNIRLEKHRFVVIAVAAFGILGPRQGRIVFDGRWYRVQDISNFLFQFISINQRLIRSGFGVTAQSAGVLQ